ncbi:hypothetical protein ACFY04_43555, partial [Streptomyces sp. NPDC001549]|uniref:hypothetical protein n=1 Tax=Streptomyces sp. NPDC001549 TaxID=3364586 RepID=UPI003692D4A6
MSSRATTSSLYLDAYTLDEIGTKNAVGNYDPLTWPRGKPLLSKNKFTNVTPAPGGVSETPQTVLLVKTSNKANPRYNPALKPGGPNVQNIPADVQDAHDILSRNSSVAWSLVGCDREWGYAPAVAGCAGGS